MRGASNEAEYHSDERRIRLDRRRVSGIARLRESGQERSGGSGEHP